MTPPLAAVRSAIAPLAVGFGTTALGSALSWVPSLWYDEAATVSAATRPVPDLIRMLGTVDAVHGLYYLLMHAWFSVAGSTPFTLRLPSALAAGAAAALLVVLVRMIADRRTALVAGIVFALLPRVGWMATEGRSSALATLLAVVATLALLAALRATTRSASIVRWTLYGASAALAITTFLYLGLLVVAHGVALLALRRRGPVVRWLVAAAAAGVLVAPLVVLELHQTGQISWIKPLVGSGWGFAVFGPWFLDDVPFAVAGWVAIAAGIALAAQRRSATLLAVAVPWLLLPIGVLVLVTVLVHPVFSPRYVAFPAPAVAILVAVALCAGRRWWIAAAGLAVLAGLTAPSYIAQRTPTAKQGSSWAEAARVIEADRAARPAGERDAVVFGPLRNHPDATMQVVAVAYPDAFRGLLDVTEGRSAASRGTLWPARVDLADAAARLDDEPVVWSVTSDHRQDGVDAAERLGARGYRADREWRTPGVTIVRFVLGGSSASGS